jgi:uncharacterized phage-like protein YoqJ
VKLFATGHRPDKLGGYEPMKNRIGTFVSAAMNREIKRLKALHPDLVGISGMALGTDQWFAELCVRNDVPFIAHLPFVGQEQKWPAASQRDYRCLLDLAQSVVICSPGGYHPDKMWARNSRMVKDGDYGIAVYNGDKNGGTFDCWRKLLESGKPYTRIDPKAISITRFEGGPGVFSLPPNAFIETDDRGRLIVAWGGHWQGEFVSDVWDQDPAYIHMLKKKVESIAGLKPVLRALEALEN